MMGKLKPSYSCSTCSTWPVFEIQFFGGHLARLARGHRLKWEIV